MENKEKNRLGEMLVNECKKAFIFDGFFINPTFSDCITVAHIDKKGYKHYTNVPFWNDEKQCALYSYKAFAKKIKQALTY